MRECCRFEQINLMASRTVEALGNPLRTPGLEGEAARLKEISEVHEILMSCTEGALAKIAGRNRPEKIFNWTFKL